MTRSTKKKLGCRFIRINTSKEGYDADYEAGRIQTFISKFKDRQLKKLNKKLKELEGKMEKLTGQITQWNQNVKNGLSKNTIHIIIHEKRTIKNKTDKNWERKLGTTNCLGCTDYTDDFKQQEVKLVNKVLREKSKGLVWWSSKSRFKKTTTQQQNIIEQHFKSSQKDLFFLNYKNIHFYCKKCKKHTSNTFQKKLVLIFRIKIKGKWKCVICLTEITFIHKIEGKYDLESKLEIYLQFFTDWYHKRTVIIIAWGAEKNTENLNSKIFKTKIGRLIMKSKCDECEFKKSRFVKQQEVKGLLSNLRIKTPLSKVPF